MIPLSRWQLRIRRVSFQVPDTYFAVLLSAACLAAASCSAAVELRWDSVTSQAILIIMCVKYLYVMYY